LKHCNHKALKQYPTSRASSEKFSGEGGNKKNEKRTIKPPFTLLVSRMKI